MANVEFGGAIDEFGATRKCSDASLEHGELVARRSFNGCCPDLGKEFVDFRQRRLLSERRGQGREHLVELLSTCAERTPAIAMSRGR